MNSMKVRPAVLAAAAAIIAAVVFLPAIAGPWIYDDRPLIAENPYVHSLSWWPRWFVTDFWDVNEALIRFGARIVYWRPAVTASYAFDWQIGGGSPAWFHATNLAYHAGVAALSFVLLRRWIGSSLAAFAAAVLFVVHPTKAESVAWIAGRTDVLCMIAILVATLGIARRLEGRRWGLLLEITGTLAAYLCKEQAIVLPVFAGAQAWVSAGRPAIDLAAVRRIIRIALPQTAVAMGYLVIRASVLPIEATQIARPLGFGDHAQAVLETMGRFVALTFAPHALSVQHGLVHFQNGHMLHSTSYVVVGAIGTVALIAAAVLARKRFPAATIGIAIYLLTLLPTSNLRYTEMQTLVSERFLYLPIFGLCFLVGAVLASVKGSWARAGYVLVAACSLMSAASALSRAADFTDEGQFWAREQRLHWDSREALTYQLRVAHQEKRFESELQLLLELKQVFDRWDPITADDVRLAYQLGETLSRLTPDADAATLGKIDQFYRDMLDPVKHTAELSVRGVHLAIATKDEAYARKLDLFRARTLSMRADLQGRLGNHDAAMELADQAQLLCRTCVTVFAKAALAYARAGHYDVATRIIDDVVGAVPSETVTQIREILDKAQHARKMADATRGPEHLQARAYELAALELWGDAYAVLAPHKEAIKKAPRFATGFAELAFRAGHPDVARDVLAAVVPSSQIDDLLAEWARRMGWSG